MSRRFVLAPVNRLWDGTDVAVLPHGALRLVDLLNLVVFAPAGLLVFHALLEHLRPGRWARLAFIAAAYLFAASYGMHEAADCLGARFCPGAGELCEIVGYQDDELSHLLFFAAVAALALAMWLRRGPPALFLYFGSSYTAGLLLTALLTMQ